MNVRFWGVRGSIAVSGPEYVATGGNTSCVELEAEGERLILDGGTGLRNLGNYLGCAPLRLHLLFSHVHWDHIQGVPFFLPAFNPDAELVFMGPELASVGSFADSLQRQMRPPEFPITLDQLAARKSFRHVHPGEAMQVGPFTVESLLLDHPNGVLGYRVTAGGKVVVYATDTEHGARVDRRIVEFARGADLLVHDAQYTDAEYLGHDGPSKVGWGHSTWEQAVEVANRAQVARVALFHHDPNRVDRGVATLEALAASRHAGAFAAREGAVVRL